MLERRRLGLLLHLGASVSSSKLNLFFVHLQAMQLVEELIPAHLHSFSNLTSLELLNLSRNALNGSFPAEIARGMIQLQILDISGNENSRASYH
ncbi:unnamed protein product [Linum trigynum]|uniref:Uncharacterized protein n=1 Tax=Linum trigynum TaxID=586398 RepID=A0AAV2EL92_9ROSI